MWSQTLLNFVFIVFVRGSRSHVDTESSYLQAQTYKSIAWVTYLPAIKSKSMCVCAPTRKTRCRARSHRKSLDKINVKQAQHLNLFNS